MQKGIFHLKGVVKHYDWGGSTYIFRLLNIENTGERPVAEYWLGTHTLGTALVKINDEEKKLSEITGDLPFLLKVLDVKEMLSIQVHPSKAGAESGFEEENRSGIPIESPLRNYKDKNHKPELMIALSDFWLLHGFKTKKEIEFTLLNVPELRELLPVFNQHGYHGLYNFLMTMPQADVNRILQPLLSTLTETYTDSVPDKNDEDYWVQKAMKLFCLPDHIDRGIFSIYLMNLVHLKKGEGIFQAAGIPHAYLEGKNVEIMANSDNVLRGGLTNKHIDVNELLKNVKTEAVVPQILHPDKQSNNEESYAVSTEEFLLSIYTLDKNESVEFKLDNPGILLLTDGHATIKSEKDRIELKPGQPAALILPGYETKIAALDGATIFKASF